MSKFKKPVAHTGDPDHACVGCGANADTRTFTVGSAHTTTLCARCGAEVMIELYRALVVGDDKALMECLPVTVPQARVIWRERRLAKVVLEERERGLGISEAIRLALWKVELAADLFIANVGRAASWR